MMYQLRIAAIVALCLAGATLSTAPPVAASLGPKPAVSAEKESFSFNGTVSKVNYAANVVEMTANGHRVSLSLEPTTAIDIAGEPGSVSDIRAGVAIHAEGVIRDGVYVAQTITIHNAAKKKGHS